MGASALGDVQKLNKLEGEVDMLRRKVAEADSNTGSGSSDSHSYSSSSSLFKQEPLVLRLGIKLSNF